MPAATDTILFSNPLLRTGGLREDARADQAGGELGRAYGKLGITHVTSWLQQGIERRGSLDRSVGGKRLALAAAEIIGDGAELDDRILAIQRLALREATDPLAGPEILLD